MEPFKPAFRFDYKIKVQANSHGADFSNLRRVQINGRCRRFFLNPLLNNSHLELRKSRVYGLSRN